MILIYYEGKSQECKPNEDGYFMYYLSFKTESIKKDFSKEDLYNNIQKSSVLSKEEKSYFQKNLIKAKKSFPYSKNDTLKKTITIYSKIKNLEKSLLKFEKINSIEKKCQPVSLFEPNDYSLSLGSGQHVYHDLIKSNDAWDLNRGGDSRILIGYTDTYLNTNHEDLQNQIHTIIHNGTPDWHGTFVGGLLASETNNNLGVASISHNSKLVFANGFGNYLDDVVQTQGVRVINLSWGHCGFPNMIDELYYKEIRDDYNIVVVAGAGNGWSSCPIGGPDVPFYPVSYPSVIGVTSVGHTYDIGVVHPVEGNFLWKDCHEYYIGNDSVHQHHDKINISAPGYSTRTTGDQSNSHYSHGWGTSFASPITASACALVASINPCLTAEEIQNIVLETADPSIYLLPENAPYIGKLGTGRLDVYEAVKRALELKTIYIQNETYSGITVTESSETIIKSGYNVTNTQGYGLVRILPNSHITFEAPHSIVLSNGFEVKNTIFET